MSVHSKKSQMRLRFSLKSLFAITTLTALCFAFIPRWRKPEPVPSLSSFSEKHTFIQDLRFSPDGRYLAIDTVRWLAEFGIHRPQLLSNTIAIVDVPTLSVRERFQNKPGNEGLAVFDRERRVAFSPDSRYLFVLPNSGGQLRTWDVKSRMWLTADWLGKEAVYRFNASPNGDWLLLGKANGSEVINVPAKRSMPAKGLPWRARQAFSSRGDFLAVATRETFEIWDVEQIVLLRSLPNHIPRKLSACLAISPDGHLLAASCDFGLELYNTSTGSKKTLLPNSGTASTSQIRTRGLSFSPDGKVLAAWGDFGLKFYDVARATELRTMPKPAILSLAFSPDGKTYATGDGDGKLAIYDVATGKKIRSAVFGDGPDGSLTFNTK